MKKSGVLLVILATFALVGCDKNESANNFIALKNFTDTKLRNISKLSDEERNAIKSGVSNYAVSCYLYAEDYNGQTCTKEKITSKFYGTDPVEIDYFSYEDQFLQFSTSDGYGGTVKKENNTFVKQGNYFTYFEQNLGNSDKEAKRMFEFVGDEKIFSFGISSLVASIQDKTNQTYGEKNTVTMSSNINSGWYKSLFVISDDEDGNFVVGLSEPVKISINTTVNVQGVSVTVNSAFTFDIFEIEYRNNLLEKSTYSAHVSSTYQGYEVAHQRAYYLNQYSYNVNPSLIF